MGITRKEFLKNMGAGTAGLSGLVSQLNMRNAMGANADKKRPNFIFVFADDLGWADLPCYGHRSVRAHGGWIIRGDLKMPNLDRMAAEGELYTQFYVTSGVCSPSRAGIMTGQFPGRLGIHDYLGGTEFNKERGMPDYLESSVPTVTRLLKESGYTTGHFGKWHLGSGDDAPSPEEYGIDRYDSCSQGPGGRAKSSERIINETINFVESNKDKPFFINAWLNDPHTPLRPTEEQMKQYENMSPRWGDQKGAFQVWYAVLSEIDRNVGRLLDKLDELGMSENTMVIFSSDNGPSKELNSGTSHFGYASYTGPFRGAKRSIYEGGVRMPFIVRWPEGTPSGKVDSSTVISAVDFLPTICTLAGIELPNGIYIEGEDMSDALLGKPLERNKPLMWENRFPVYGIMVNRSPILAIREGKWKLLMNPDRSRVELYDIPNDPTEVNNRADLYPEVVKRMSEKVLSWQATLPKGPVHKDAGSNYYPWPGQ